VAIHARNTFKNLQDPNRVSASAKGIDRRSTTRLRVVESWQKTIEPPSEQGDNNHTSAEKLSVSVWVARTSSLLQAHSAFKLLTEDDWDSFERLRAPAARNSAMAAKILLRLGLSLSVDRRITPGEWRFRKTPLGKPLISGPLENINFSVSHAEAVTMVAVCPNLHLGIDVESIDQDLPGEIVSGFCNSKEQAALKALPQSQKAREFIRLWTQKEAYTKLLGCGHSLEFSSIDCLPEVGHSRWDARAMSAIHFESFFVPADRSLYHASLAIEHASLGSVDVRLSNVVGPEITNNADVIPTVS
jgi:phosphopantetheinyl transferase